VLNAVWVPFIWYFYVETAKFSLEEIDLMFKIKYHGGKSMTYKEAGRQAREETHKAKHAISEKDDMQVNEKEIVV
jgi:hypothetical protein